MDTNTQDKIYALEREVDTLNGVVGRLIKMIYDGQYTNQEQKRMLRKLLGTLPFVEDYEFLKKLR